MPKKNYSILLFFILCAVILVVVVLSWVLTKKTSSQSQSEQQAVSDTIFPTSVPIVLTPSPYLHGIWQRYTNDKLGLSFEFPSDWITTPNSYNYEDATNTVIGHGVVGLVVANFAATYQDPGSHAVPPPSFTVTYWDNPNNLSLQAYNKALSDQSGFNFGLYTGATQSIRLQSLLAYHDPSAACDPAFCDRYIIVTNGKFIQFDRLYPDQTKALPDTRMQDIFSHLISTISVK